MFFKYKAYNKTGKKISGKIEADDIKTAKQKLNDLIIIEIKPTKNFNLNFSFSKKIPKIKLAKLFTTIGLYLKSGITLINAIKLTKNQQEDIKLEKFLNYIYKEISEGKNFYTALKSQKIISIPNFILSAFQVGEESGKLDIVMLEIANFLKTEDKIESKSIQALIYPMFIVIVSIFMVAFMLTTVVPKIVKVFSNLHQDLPTITKIVINSGNFLENNWIILTIIITFIYISVSFSYKKFKKFKFFIDSILLKIPLISKIIEAKEIGRFTYLTYILTSSGINYVSAISLATNTIQNSKIKSIFDKAMQEVIEGKKFSIALAKAGFWDKSFLQALSLAEETSEVNNIMKNLSEIYFEENENRINIVLSILEPMLIVIVGGVIGFIVTALLLPMFSMDMFK